jgi:hypothetical protein
MKVQLSNIRTDTESGGKADARQGTRKTGLSTIAAGVIKMPVESQLPLSYSNQYSAESACSHCDGVIRHEPWCMTQNASVQYAYQAVSDSRNLSPGDHLILHALGTAWTPKRSLSKVRQ